MAETEPLIAQPAVAEETPVLRSSVNKKWILLVEFGLLALLQGSIFLAWNPIANSALYAFGPSWSASTFAWQLNLATIMSPIFQYPVWKSMKKFNLSKTLTWGAVFPLVLASFINSMPLFTGEYISSEVYKWLSYGAFFLVGLTGVVFFSSITRFSSVWFPPGERATSTGLACTMANLGGLLPSLIGPQIVTDPIKDQSISRIDVAQEIHVYMLMFFLLSLLLWAIFYFHFPDVDDEVEEHVDEASLKSDLVSIFKSKHTVLVILVASLGSIPHIWGSTLLTVTLSRLKISQVFVGLTTTMALAASTFFTIVISRIADVYFTQDLKKLVMSLLPIHALSMIVMSVLVLTGSHDQNHQFGIGFFFIVAIGILNCVSPLILELGAEMSHPVSEEIIAGVINQANNFFGVIFYLLFSYLTVERWLLYLLMSLPVATLFMFALIQESYLRPNTNLI